jgi:hypothetical protein
MKGVMSMMSTYEVLSLVIGFVKLIIEILKFRIKKK